MEFYVEGKALLGGYLSGRSHTHTHTHTHTQLTLLLVAVPDDRGGRDAADLDHRPCGG